MGHESQIEPWLAHDQRSACWFHKSLASSQIEYENHRGRTQKRCAVVRSVPSLWSGMREQSCSIPRGLKINKIQPKAKCFLLTFLLIELSRQSVSPFREASYTSRWIGFVNTGRLFIRNQTTPSSMSSVPAVSRQLFWICRRIESPKCPVAFQKEACQDLSKVVVVQRVRPVSLRCRVPRRNETASRPSGCAL